MNEADIVQVAIDAELVLWVAASSFAVICFLLIALAKAIVSGMNKTISNIHSDLSGKLREHQRRINILEKVVYRREGG